MEQSRSNRSTEFVIGSEVTCRHDVICGELRRVIIDPVVRSLTHLVVEPRHRVRMGRLVPIDLVDTRNEEIRLRCTAAEFAALDHAEETDFLPGLNGQWDGQEEQMMSWPSYGFGGNINLGGGIGMGPQAVTHDQVPEGEVEVRRGQHVHALDGTIGRFQGLVIEPAKHQITHVLIGEGHLWGHKTVALPISAVTSLDDGVELNLTRVEIHDLPPIDLSDHHSPVTA